VKRIEKEAKVNQIQAVLMDASSAVFLDYRGLNVEKITMLRRKLGEVSVDFYVIKNTLTKRAAAGTIYESLSDYLKGPTAAAISKGDPVAGFKVIDEFSREYPNLKFKIAMVGGQTINQEQMVRLADLPPREVLLGKLLGTMQAPVSGLVRLLAANISGLLNVLNGLKESRE
jgi:large subunit ribosomal protein L10